MPRVVVSHLDEGVVSPLPPEVSAEGQVESRIILGADRPIHMWIHKLAPGATLTWSALRVGHVIYLWSGALIAGGRRIDGEGAVAIEHGASYTIEASEAGCELVEFNSQVEATRRCGGHVHVVGVAEAPAGPMSGRTGEYGLARAYADSDCPSCELWLHENRFTMDYSTKRHFHDQDEVILCTAGVLNFGTRNLSRGGVLAVDKLGVYMVGSQAGGAFVNFRPGPPQITVVGRDGHKPPKAEMMLMRTVTLVPPHEVAPPVDARA
jgi:hypothetical protein